MAAIVAAVFLAASAVAIVLRIYLIGAILRGLGALPGIGKRLRIDTLALRETEDLLFVILRERPRRLLALLAVDLLAQVPLFLELYILLAATGQAVSLIDPLLIESSTKFLTFAAFFIPGQIGASEGLYALVFQAMGLSPTAGFSVALARRLRNLLVAAIGLIFLWRRKGGRTHDASSHRL